MATYGSEVGVEGINAHFEGGYTATSVPTSTQITTFLADGYAFLNAQLALAGYAVPAGTGTLAIDVLARLNNLYAAACAEDAVNLSTSGLDEESRSRRLWARFNRELADFLAGNLVRLGLALSSSRRGHRRVRSLSLRKRDGFAQYFDPDNEEYADVASAGKDQSGGSLT